MPNIITSSVSDSLVRRTADVPEYKVVGWRIRKAMKAHLRRTGVVVEKV